MSRGFLFLNVGTKYDDRLIVAVGSLRDFHDEPIHIMTDTYDNRGAKECIKRFDDVSIGIVNVPRRRNGAYLFKSTVAHHTPFESTIFLDADTLTLGDMSSLWTDYVMLTTWAGWNTLGGIIGGRVRAWEKICPDLVKKALSEPFAAINTGVFSWGVNGKGVMDEWEELTARNVSFLCDEISFQILFCKYNLPALDDRFNASSKFAHADESTWRLAHGHGFKHRSYKMKPYWEKKAKELGIPLGDE